MTNNVIQITQFSQEEFLGLLEQKIALALEKINAKNSSDEDRQFYTRAETASRLQVSFATLHNWAKSGELTPQKIGKRVYYSKDLVMAKLSLNA